MNADIIATGSKGNAVVVEGNILVDCGVSFKALAGVYRNVKLVLLTHAHSDHLQRATITRLANERPTLRFGCCEWLVHALLECGVSPKRIDVYEPGKVYNYNAFKIAPVALYHNVLQCGYRIITPNGKAFYATDTNTLEGIEAKGYDLYMVEANFGEEEIKDRIKSKQEAGQYAYELDVLHNHLSKEKCDAWLMENMTERSQYIYMHGHKEE